MSKKLRHFIRAGGFTLIELLVVIAIITMLVAIFTPGLMKFKDHARKLKQKSNIRNAEIGLELYYERFKSYPDSEYLDVFGSTNKVVCGAQHMVEALLGRDERGFDPETKWHEFDEDSDNIYDTHENTPKGVRSINRRRGPYLELRDTGAYLLDQLYGAAFLSAATYKGKTLLSDDTATDPEDGSKRAPVLTDVFTTRLPTTGERVGTPLVYFKASTKYAKHKEVPLATTLNFSQWRYNYDDNAWIFKLPHLKDPDDLEKPHRYSPDYVDPDTGETGRQLFYKAITNRNSNYEKPYNPTTYIIISAGNDGIFGTKDDATNF